jgi:ribosomal protein S24E
VLLASVGVSIPLQILASDGDTGLYGEIRVYSSAMALVATLDADHTADGVYSVAWTPSQEGVYTFVGQLYTDVGRTIDAGYEKQGEQIDVNTIKSSLVRILGLHHENAVVDMQTYDTEGNMVTARVRIYDSKANAQAGGATGVVNQYSIAAAYTGGALSKYTMVLDS